jgi:hypothetical protein
MYDLVAPVRQVDFHRVDLWARIVHHREGHGTEVLNELEGRERWPLEPVWTC